MKKAIKTSGKKNIIIGFLCGSFTDPFQRTLFKAIASSCKARKVSFITFLGGTLKSPYYSWEQRNSVFELVSERNIDGIIALSSTLGNFVGIDGLLSFYSQYAGIPLLSIGLPIDGIPSLLVDNRKGMEELITHLITVHKAKRIAFIRGTEGNPEAELRYSVYLKMLKKNNLPFDPQLITPGDFSSFSGTESVSLLIDRRKVSFDVLLSSNDQMAYYAINALRERGLNVPEDIPVTGFDDIPKSKCFIPPLTTVRQPWDIIGEKAVNLILDKINGYSVPDKMILPTELVIRRSCGCLEKGWNSYSHLKENKENAIDHQYSSIKSIIGHIINKIKNTHPKDTILSQKMLLWINELIKALKNGLKEKNFSGFKQLLDSIFNELRTSRGDISYWNYIINHLCDYNISLLHLKKDRQNVEILRKNALEMLAETLRRSKEYEIINIQEQSIELNRISQEIVSGFQLEAVKNFILEKIPRMGFESCYIILYKKKKNNQVNKKYARIAVAVHKNKEIFTHESRKYYSSIEIIPGTLKKVKGTQAFVIIPINFKEELLGYGVFEHGPENLLLYGNLILQLSSAIKEISLIEQQEHHAQKLEKEVKESVSALKKTTTQLKKERNERKKTEEALQIAQKQALVTLKSIGEGVITTDTKGIITYLNPVAEELTGWKNNEAMGKPLSRIFNVVYHFSDKMVENPVDIALGHGQDFKISGSIILKSRDLREYEIEELISPIRNFSNKVIGAVLIIRNISETKKMSRELSYQRTHDQLTSLVNRIRFEEILVNIIQGLKEEKKEHCLCFLDIDSFRIINDASGHAAGDELIKRISSLLKGCVRQADILARLGGDQFGLLLITCPFKRAKEITENILNKMNNYTFIWKGNSFRVRMSIGLVYIDSYADNISRILTAANFACYLAKRKGGNQLHVYHSEDEASVKYQSEMHFIPYISKAIKENRFCLYKQVIRPIGYGVPANDHFEILLRMKDDKGNVISPSLFLQIAERYNLMPEIDRWVIEKLFSSYKVDYYETPEKAYAKYSINISGVTLNDEKFLDFVINKLKEYRIPPYMVCFEITETAAISNFSQVITFIKELKRIGCFFSLDDFGSGWSSFNYLKILPVDFLKIEGSFVREIALNPLDYVLVQTMNHIGHVIGLKTIAEYVENKEILNRLKKIGVDYAQGYGIAKPEPFVF